MKKDDTVGLPQLDLGGPTMKGSMGQIFTNVVTRITAEDQTKTDIKLMEAVQARDRLLSATADLRNAGMRTATQTAKQESDLIRAEDEVTRLLKERKDRDKPGIVSEVDRINAENEALRAKSEQNKLKIELEKQEAQLRNISNGARQEQNREPKHESFPARMAREFRNRAETKLDVMRVAEELALKNPEEREYIMREAKKYIEALRERT